MNKHNTTLDQHTVATLKAYGGGTLSEGIRRAAELVRASESTRDIKTVILPVDQLWSEAPENEELVGAIRRRNAKRRVEE